MCNPLYHCVTSFSLSCPPKGGRGIRPSCDLRDSSFWVSKLDLLWDLWYKSRHWIQSRMKGIKCIFLHSLGLLKAPLGLAFITQCLVIVLIPTYSPRSQRDSWLCSPGIMWSLCFCSLTEIDCNFKCESLLSRSNHKAPSEANAMWNLDIKGLILLLLGFEGPLLCSVVLPALHSRDVSRTSRWLSSGELPYLSDKDNFPLGGICVLYHCHSVF